MLGTEVQVPGKAVGAGLSAGAAEELGLSPGTPVATGIIDAHAGGVGKIIHLMCIFIIHFCTCTCTCALSRIKIELAQ